MADSRAKSDQAFRTIGELAGELGVPQHVLRYWETRFEQLRPLQRAGNRRYYRPADVALARRIHRLLDQEGYTIRGVQQLLAAKASESEAPASGPPAPPSQVEMNGAPNGAVSIDDLRALRGTLAEALALSA
jgi:DNA-binding transcriptional MerR regulator